MGLSTKQIGNKEVIVVDCSNMGTNNTSEIKEILDKASGLMSSKNLGSVYTITNITNMGFNRDISSAYKEYAKINTPYVKASVVVGVSGMQSVVLNAIKKFSGGEFELVETMKDAESYLLSV